MSEDSMASAASPIKLNRPSGIRPIRPHCGQGPDRFPLRVMSVEFSNELPERKMVPQVWQIAGRVDMAARLARPSAACGHNVICRNSTVTRLASDEEATVSVHVACRMIRSETVCSGHSRTRKIVSEMEIMWSEKHDKPVPKLIVQRRW